MGYRSHVAFIIKFHSIQDRDALWMLFANSDSEGKQQMAKAVQHEYAEPFITYEHTDIKWYEGYDFVQAAEEMMSQAVELFNACWRFVSVGEDNNDNEEKEDGENADELWDYINLVRTVETSFPHLADTSSASSSTPVTSTI
jgi:hypothetical protein